MVRMNGGDYGEVGCGEGYGEGNDVASHLSALAGSVSMLLPPPGAWPSQPLEGRAALMTHSAPTKISEKIRQHEVKVSMRSKSACK